MTNAPHTPGKTMLWLCIDFPNLPLEIYGNDPSVTTPVAVVHREQARAWVHRCNPAAGQLGIRAGMTVATAQSLSRHLLLKERQPEQEQQALERLAGWAGIFSSHVALRAPTALVLEIGSSLKLFSGLAGLKERLQHEMRELGYTSRYSLGQTPFAAQHLAQSGVHCWQQDSRVLHGSLAALPIECLQGFPAAVRGLHGVGLRTIGELLDLPMGGIGKRWGKEFLTFLSDLVQDRPAQLTFHAPPPQFCHEVEFAAEVTHQQMLLFPVRRLLTELAAWLNTRHLQCTHFTLRLFHRLQGATVIPVHLSAPGHSAEVFLSLLRLRLEQLHMQAPALAVELQADQVIELAAGNRDLFQRTSTRRHDLVDQLNARLGAGSATGLEQVSEHRPEKAWCNVPAGKAHSSASNLTRPTWLLPEPRPMGTRQGLPWSGTQMEILDGPERIEAGWWNHQPVHRDYYVARRNDGMRLWLYREIPTGNWYCHGFFG